MLVCVPPFAVAVSFSTNGWYACGAPAAVPFAAGSAPVVMTFATLLAETSRRRAAAFIPDTAIAEMLLTGLSLGGGGAIMRMRPRNVSFTLAIKFERNAGGGVNDNAMGQPASSARTRPTHLGFATVRGIRRTRRHARN